MPPLELDCRFSTNWSSPIVFYMTTLRRPNRKHDFPQFCSRVFTNPLLKNGLHNIVVLSLRACILQALPSNGRYLQSRRLSTGLYATLSKIHFKITFHCAFKPCSWGNQEHMLLVRTQFSFHIFLSYIMVPHHSWYTTHSNIKQKNTNYEARHFSVFSSPIYINVLLQQQQQQQASKQQQQ
jgi:hypothetical protein